MLSHYFTKTATFNVVICKLPSRFLRTMYFQTLSVLLHVCCKKTHFKQCGDPVNLYDISDFFSYSFQSLNDNHYFTAHVLLKRN